MEELQLTAEETQQMTETQEAPVVETPAPEAPVTPPPAPVVEAPKEQKMVPLPALIEAREEQRALKRQIEEFKREFISFKERYAKPPVEQPKVPAFDEDPLNHMKARLQELDKVVTKQEQLDQNYQQINENQQMANTIGMMENEFRQTTPDYYDAHTYLTNFRIEELKEFGITDPKQVSQILANNAVALSRQAMEIGKNPAELVYNLARRYGYKKESVVPAPPSPQQAQTQQVQNAMAQQQMKDLQAIEQGQQVASKTLSGGKSDTDNNMEALMNAEGKEFDEMWKTVFKGAK